jgi:hypothetical protein
MRNKSLFPLPLKFLIHFHFISVLDVCACACETFVCVRLAPFFPLSDLSML